MVLLWIFIFLNFWYWSFGCIPLLWIRSSYWRLQLLVEAGASCWRCHVWQNILFLIVGFLQSSSKQRTQSDSLLLEFFFPLQRDWTVHLGQNLALDHCRRYLSGCPRSFLVSVEINKCDVTATVASLQQSQGCTLLAAIWFTIKFELTAL